MVFTCIIKSVTFPKTLKVMPLLQKPQLGKGYGSSWGNSETYALLISAANEYLGNTSICQHVCYKRGLADLTSE